MAVKPILYCYDWLEMCALHSLIPEYIMSTMNASFLPFLTTTLGYKTSHS